MAEYTYDHYKDTCSKQDSALGDRNRFFLATATFACLLAAYAYDPDAATGLASMWLSRYGIDLLVSARVVQTALWLGTLYSYMRYLQASTTVERRYLYINELEAKLREEGDERISREGVGYSVGWPMVSRVIDFLYKYVFVAALCLVCAIKLFSEFPSFSIVTLADLACCLLVLVLSALYVIFIRKVDAAYDGPDGCGEK